MSTVWIDIMEINNYFFTPFLFLSTSVRILGNLLAPCHSSFGEIIKDMKAEGMTNDEIPQDPEEIRSPIREAPANDPTRSLGQVDRDFGLRTTAAV